jgi:Regulator of chromosome condensation (RCC1) repeat
MRTGGDVCFYSFATAELILDVSGDFSEPAGLCWAMDSNIQRGGIMRYKLLSLAVVALALVLTACDSEVPSFYPANKVPALVSEFHGLTPARLLDTRGGRPGATTSVAAAVGPREEVALTVRGVGRVPLAGAGAVVLNITATGATNATFLTVWPSGALRPNASSLNVIPGRDIANLTVMALPADGQIRIYNDTGSVHVIVDVMGWFVEGSGFVGLTPARLADTRPGTSTVDGGVLGGGPVGSAAALDVGVLGRGGVPATRVAAVIANVTVTNPTKESFVTVWASGTAQPVASNLNMVTGQTVPNLVLAKPGANGKIAIANAVGLTDVIVDVVGYVPVGSQLTPIDPARVLDTRGSTNPWPAGSAIGNIVPIAGLGGVPSNAGSVVMNVTAVPDLKATAALKANGYNSGLLGPSFVTVYPTGVALPTASNLNSVFGLVTPNLVISKLGADGSVSIFVSAAPTDIIIDVLGWMPAETATPIELASGAQHVCARFGDGRIACEGSNTTGQLGDGGPSSGEFRLVPGIANAVSVASGPFQSCAALKDGAVTCWGQSTNGAVTPPTDVLGLAAATSVAVAAQHSCAIVASGEVACWGYNGFGQLGNGMISNTLTATPTRVPGITDALQIKAAGNSTCVRRATGTVSCWGDNSSHQMRNPASTAPAPSPVDVIVNPNVAIDIAVDTGSICAVVAGASECWGSNIVGQLGDLTTASGGSHRVVPPTGSAARVFSGGGHACLVSTTGVPLCWGSLDSTTRNASDPQAIPSLGVPISLTSSVGFSCAAQVTGRIVCLGTMPGGVPVLRALMRVVSDGKQLHAEEITAET